MTIISLVSLLPKRSLRHTVIESRKKFQTLKLPPQIDNGTVLHARKDLAVSPRHLFEDSKFSVSIRRFEKNYFLKQMSDFVSNVKHSKRLNRFPD